MSDAGPALVSLDEIAAAHRRIAGGIHRTPLFSAASLGRPLGVDLRLKAELFQKTGSFKARGVLNRLRTLPADRTRRGFVTLSAGNHGAALAWAAAQLGAPAVVVMPAAAPAAKVEAVRAYGGEAILTSGDILEEAQRVQAERRLELVHPFDDPAIIAGQGTVGLEILEDGGDVATVVVPVGGGGLISGVAAAIKARRPSTHIIGVEPVGADAMSRSIAVGHPVRLDRTDTVADGLAAPFAGALTYAHVRRLVDDVVVVDDAAILEALRLIISRAKLAAEPAGAAAFAALLAGAARVPRDGPVVCVVSGGNLDASVWRRL